MGQSPGRPTNRGHSRRSRTLYALLFSQRSLEPPILVGARPHQHCLQLHLPRQLSDHLVGKRSAGGLCGGVRRWPTPLWTLRRPVHLLQQPARSAARLAPRPNWRDRALLVEPSGNLARWLNARTERLERAYTQLRADLRDLRSGVSAIESVAAELLAATTTVGGETTAIALAVAELVGNVIAVTTAVGALGTTIVAELESLRGTIAGVGSNTASKQQLDALQSLVSTAWTQQLTLLGATAAETSNIRRGLAEQQATLGSIRGATNSAVDWLASIRRNMATSERTNAAGYWLQAIAQYLGIA